MQVNGLKLFFGRVENLRSTDVIIGGASNFYVIFPQILEPALVQKWMLGTWTGETSCTPYIPSRKLDVLWVSLIIMFFFLQCDSIRAGTLNITVFITLC